MRISDWSSDVCSSDLGLLTLAPPGIGGLGAGGKGHMQKTVLVVEDNDLNMKLFCDLLEAHGYRTMKTRDGRSVPDLVRADRPDLILMDIQLPEVSGRSAARRVGKECVSACRSR